METVMNVLGFMKNIVNGNLMQAKEILGKELSERTTNAIEFKKVELAKNLFKQD